MKPALRIQGFNLLPCAGGQRCEERVIKRDILPFDGQIKFGHAARVERRAAVQADPGFTRRTPEVHDLQAGRIDLQRSRQTIDGVREPGVPGEDVAQRNG